ncbi:2-hydroxyacid dehydrogenase [Alteromonas sp. BMJM2]|uniref:2-hydroxyacid dehydrogenase n=1 Tax=Alteromonas sp. BMJM2 TaxID=2954241 RepID=UPI0022B448C9|nr:2-hydroxyacid dehydrogenase [Alteromonas sp. BMJM2]
MENKERLNVACFSTQDYDKAVFEKAINSAEPPYADSVAITYLSHRLTASTARLCEGYNVVIAFVNDDISAATVKALAHCNVKHIALRCAGFNNVDINAAHEHGIQVSRVPAYSPETVAEHTIALILTLNRQTHKAYNRVREGNFALSGLMGFTLHNKTVGVVGTGKIGCSVIRILSGFGCRILCYDPNKNHDAMDLGAQYVDLETLFAESIIVSLHCPLNESSHHMINSESLHKMQDGVMLINTSRGGLVDDKAIIDGLKSKKIGYLGLDVYERESELFFTDHSQDIIQDDNFQRLTTFPNVLITGHQGFFTAEALSEIAQVTLANIVNKTNIVTL